MYKLRRMLSSIQIQRLRSKQTRLRFLEAFKNKHKHYHWLENIVPLKQGRVWDSGCSTPPPLKKKKKNLKREGKEVERKKIKMNEGGGGGGLIVNIFFGAEILSSGAQIFSGEVEKF